MEQESLFHETWADALRAVCEKCGGIKKVASQLRPNIGTDQAARLVSSWFNPDRPEKPDFDDIRAILRIGKQNGCHLGKHWLDDDLGYQRSQPIEPRDELAELQRDYISAAKNMQRIAERIERVQLRIAS